MNKFCEQLREEYPNLCWRVGKKFAYRPPRTIVVEQNFEQDCYNLLVLHELGHALCEHKNYGTDAERLKMERQAWEKARELAKKYEVEYVEELVEEKLDSYREWLHQKSTCKRCGLTMYQKRNGGYFCPQCDA